MVANTAAAASTGRSGHTQAVRAGRHKVHEDFAAVARDLVARGITTPEQLGAQGGSNGGLLMGIMLTKYPELFGAIVCQVPLLDMKRYHLLLAGASWMAEYGDPDNADDWAFISEYSPYQNTSATAAYPRSSSPRPPATTASTPGTPGRWPRDSRTKATRSTTTRTSRAGTAAPRTMHKAAFKSALTTRSCGTSWPVTARRRFGAVPVLVAAALLGLAPAAGAGGVPNSAALQPASGALITRVENTTDRWVRVFVYSPAMQSEQEVQVLLLPRDTSVPRPSLYLLDGRSASPV